MRRGDLVTVAANGDFGKPRPALVIQADAFAALHSATLLPLTGTLLEAPLMRVTLQPSALNRLHKPSQVMIDKAITVRRERMGPAFGQIDGAEMMQVERCLAVFLGIAK